MIPLNILLQHSLFYGGILSILMSALILITLYRWPMIWVGDAPEDIQAVAGPMSDSDRRIQRLSFLVTVLILIGVFTAATLQLSHLSIGPLSFMDVALSTFIIYMTFNVVDLLLIDWLLVATIRPQFVMLPGTETMTGYSDYAFHFRAFLKGTAGGVFMALIVAAVSVGIGRLL